MFQSRHLIRDGSWACRFSPGIRDYLRMRRSSKRLRCPRRSGSKANSDGSISIPPGPNWSHWSCAAPMARSNRIRCFPPRARHGCARCLRGQPRLSRSRWMRRVAASRVATARRSRSSKPPTASRCAELPCPFWKRNTGRRKPRYLPAGIGVESTRRFGQPARKSGAVAYCW